MRERSLSNQRLSVCVPSLSGGFFFWSNAMTFGTAFWIIMLIWLIFGFWRSWGDHYAMGGSLMQFVLFLLLGWKVFGAPVHG